MYVTRYPPPIKSRVIRSQQVPYMHSGLRKEMYKRNMLKNKYFKNHTQQLKDQYVKQRNKVTGLRKQAIRSYFMEKCSGNVKRKDFFNVVRPFMTGKSNTHRNIILNEDEIIVLIDKRSVKF